MAGRHTARAVLPQAGYRRPASLDPTGLVVSVWAENGGVEGVFDFTPLPGSVALRQALAAAFDSKSGPGGPWRARATCATAHKYVAEFMRWLDTQDRPQTAADLTAAVWNRWRMALPATAQARRRLTVVRLLTVEVRGLPPETRAALARRMPKRAPSKEVTYTYQEYTAIRATAAAIFTRALARLRANREHLRRWHAGEFAEPDGDWLIGAALDHLERTGDVPLINVGRGTRAVRIPFERALGGRRSVQTWGRLYLTRTEAFAAAVLLVASESWNRSVLDEMRVPDHDPAVGDEVDIYRVNIHKRRRPVRLRHTTNNLLDHGPGSPGRLMGQIIEATGTGRRTLALLGRPTDRLLVYRLNRHDRDGDLFQLGVPQQVRLDTEPGLVSLRRLRRTVQVLIRKEPAQNSQRTHESVYVLPDPATRTEATATIVQGLSDAVEHATVIATMRMMLGDDTDTLIELSDDPELAAALQRGELDTATGACTDLTNSPFTPAGLPCTASFLLCLACPNAVATRRHLPRLVHLHDAMTELRAVVDADVWELDWRVHFTRLSALLGTHTTAAEQAAARGQLTAADRARIAALLHRKLDA
ncbi:hypothetical protein [Frankia sp. CiP3]|uniref:hypothetical protein n=1 Tax=Frankia sp. CiP3 TaxID=2880971 RepID=UPI001EF73BE6|nr:hypothetical protein [Frankia sp. CiP3]